jgi:hypothetical protein
MKGGDFTILRQSAPVAATTIARVTATVSARNGRAVNLATIANPPMLATKLVREGSCTQTATAATTTIIAFKLD